MLTATQILKKIVNQTIHLNCKTNAILLGNNTGFIEKLQQNFKLKLKKSSKKIFKKNLQKKID